MSSTAATHTNGIADKLLDEARARVANGTAEDDDRLMLVMEALSARGIEAAKDHNSLTIRMFGRNWNKIEIGFAFGALLAAKGASGIAHLF